MKGVIDMNAKDFLLQIKKLDRMIANKQIEVQQLKELACNTSPNMSGERVQATGNPHKIADAIGKYIDLEREIQRRVDELVNVRCEVIAVIEQLNTVEYDILHKIYVQNLTFYDVADAYDKTYSWATTVHGRALKQVQDILDGKVET